MLLPLLGTGEPPTDLNLGALVLSWEWAKTVDISYIERGDSWCHGGHLQNLILILSELYFTMNGRKFLADEGVVRVLIPAGLFLHLVAPLV